MADSIDVAARLSEGSPSVDNIEHYVRACRSIGYENADLTTHPGQIRDWYVTEYGMDLRALDADCTALQAAASATGDAVTHHVEQIGALTAAWQGAGAEASRAFLRRHGEAAAQAAAAVRSAAEALADLRDQLWHVVDSKVVATQSIDDRASAQRAEWLAAAQTVTTGDGDRSVASELIDQHVKPFVDNDVRSDWVTAMRTAIAAINDAYGAAVTELSSLTQATFDIPGDLGPSWTPPPVPARDDAGAAPGVTAPTATVPASVISAAPAWSAPPGMPMAPTAPAMAPAAAPPSPMTPPLDPAAPPGGMGGGMGGMPDIGGGLSGLGQQLADAFGGLLGSAEDAVGNLPGSEEGLEIEKPDDLSDENDEEPDDELDDEFDELDEAAEDPDGDAVDEKVEADEVVAESAAPEQECLPPGEPTSAPDEPAPTPPPVPAAAEPITPPPTAMAAETPCQIAADELPQVGE